MNTIDFTLPNGFKFHQGTLEFLQDSVLQSARASASYGGALAVLSGCEVNGSNVSAGMVVIDGEVLPFEAGTLDVKVIVQETIINLPYEDGTLQAAKKIRVAKFGDDGVTNYLWGDFKRNTAEGVLARLERLERVAAPFTNANKGGMVLWNRPANTIPTGWQEVADWRGRLPVGLDEAQLEFNEVGKTGGAKDVKMTLANLIEHDHDVPVSNGAGTLQRLNGTPNQAPTNLKTTKTGSADPTPMNTLNPYRVVVFIEYIGG